jgi:hypothetical protein
MITSQRVAECFPPSHQKREGSSVPRNPAEAALADGMGLCGHKRKMRRPCWIPSQPHMARLSFILPRTLLG